MNIITLGDKKFIKYIDRAEIDRATETIAAQINEDYKNDLPVFLITLNGAIFFAADLLRRIHIDLMLTCIRLSSYKGTVSTENVKNIIGLEENLKGKRVVIIEDIVDTGHTYEHIIHLLENQEVKDIRIATMTFKPDAYSKPYPVHYPALTIPPKFIVGRGLDYEGLGRNYSDIYQIVND